MIRYAVTKNTNLVTFLLCVPARGRLFITHWYNSKQPIVEDLSLTTECLYSRNMSQISEWLKVYLGCQTEGFCFRSLINELEMENPWVWKVFTRQNSNLVMFFKTVTKVNSFCILVWDLDVNSWKHKFILILSKDMPTFIFFLSWVCNVPNNMTHVNSIQQSMRFLSASNRKYSSKPWQPTIP